MTAVNEVETWRGELVAAALIGADRRRAPQPPSTLGVAVPNGVPNGRDARTNLLDQAALHDVLLRAGRRPQQGARLTAAPPETLPVAPAAATELLGLVLAQPPVPPELRLRLIRLWLDSANRNGMIVPPRLLPALLDVARTDDAVGTALESTWGFRGAWLADQLDLAGKAVPAAAARPPFADQALARDLLAQEWKELPARVRESRLAALEAQLSRDDEALLEAALDDGARGVRERARTLLSRLTESAFATRMTARLLPLITVNRRLLSGRSIEVSPPQHIDEAAIRDGFVAPHAGAVPDRVSWLARIVESAPLATWTTATGLDVRRTLALLLPDQALRRPLLEAVQRQRDRAWAAEFLDQTGALEVIPLLEPAALDAWLISGLRDSSARVGPIQFGLSHAPEPWSEALAEAVLDRLEAADTAVHTIELTPAQATALPASVLPRVARLLATEGDSKGRRSLAAAVQYHSIARSIREALP